MNAPTLEGTPGDRFVDLQIGVPAGATRVRVRMASGSSPFATVYEGPATSTRVTGLTNGRDYRFKARGFDMAGRGGPFSVPDLVLTPVAPSAAVIGGWGSGATGGGPTPTHVIDAGGAS